MTRAIPSAVLTSATTGRTRLLSPPFVPATSACAARNVDSKVILPLNKRSALPDVEYGSVEQVPQFRDLPPGYSVNLGIKADGRSPGERVLSVTLVNSQVL